uniref:Uncharacterized protein n=1 Tax=Wuchereria bancrofti TaxID=6293 RepID=A0AAF5PJR9_WUCBA
MNSKVLQLSVCGDDFLDAARNAWKRQRVRSEQRDREDVVAFQKMHEEKLIWQKAKVERTTPVSDSSCETFSCIDG